MSEFIKQKQVEGLVSALASKALDSAVVKKSNNLSDVNAASARTNLDVYSKAEVQNMVAGAEDAYSVASITARNALTGLKVSDRVFVSNDGDGKWALYLVSSVTNGQGSTSEFVKVADEDLFTNALSKEAVKSAYESNANTNAFTDSEKTKLDHLSVTQPVNLDQIESDLADNIATADTALTTANTANNKANTAQSTANTARTEAAAAQSAADTALSNAATAQLAANNAQSTANTAETKADNAQVTANTARSEAASAQSTADTALSAANARELAFTEAVEDFTGIVSAGGLPVALELNHLVAPGFVPMVFFNGIRVKTISFTPGSSNLTYTVPYETEGTDTLTVQYAHR
jgi:hypothetical protein